MNAKDLDCELILQAIEPGTTIPAEFPRNDLFLLSFSSVLKEDIWDDYGNKEIDQAGRLRQLAGLIQSMADDLEELGHVLKSYPDPNDLDDDVYRETWSDVSSEMEEVFEKGYVTLAEHVMKLRVAAAGDFMG